MEVTSLFGLPVHEWHTCDGTAAHGHAAGSIIYTLKEKPMNETQMILEIMKAATKGTYMTIDAIHDAMEDDGRIDTAEGIRLGLVTAQIGMEMQPMIAAMLREGLSMEQVSHGMRLIYQKLSAADAADVFGL